MSHKPPDQSDVPGRETVAADGTNAAHLEQILAQFPAMTQAIFIAWRIHGRSIGQIMQTTGLTRRAIQRHLHRAIAGIHDALGGP